MEKLSAEGSETVLNIIVGSVLLVLGEFAEYVHVHSSEVEAIKFLFQCFAWGGAGTIGLIAMIKFIKSFFS